VEEVRVRSWMLGVTGKGLAWVTKLAPGNAYTLKPVTGEPPDRDSWEELQAQSRVTEVGLTVRYVGAAGATGLDTARMDTGGAGTSLRPREFTAPTVKM